MSKPETDARLAWLLLQTEGRLSGAAHEAMRGKWQPEQRRSLVAELQFLIDRMQTSAPAVIDPDGATIDLDAKKHNDTGEVSPLLDALRTITTVCASGLMIQLKFTEDRSQLRELLSGVEPLLRHAADLAADNLRSLQDEPPPVQQPNAADPFDELGERG